MGLRCTLHILLLVMWSQSEASSIRNRRQLQSDSESYQPPLLLSPNSYQPPLGRSVDSSVRQLENLSRDSASAATSYSVHPSHSEASGLQQSSAADAHSKAVSHVPIQSIHKAPASEIQAEKVSSAKEKDNKNDEYIVYYYYYYDNDTTPNNNLSLNFDDIPSLESYDDDKNVKEPQKSASARTLATNINSVLPIADEQNNPSDYSSSSQPRSAAGINKETVFKPDRKEGDFEDAPFKPVSNVFRYAANEVPRFPVLPNFIVSEVQTTTSANVEMTPQSFDHLSPPQVNLNPQYPNLSHDEDDAVNNVLDSASSIRVNEDKLEEEDITTTVAPTTEPPTTTEIITTTTTEKSSRRRPPIGGGRRRFNPSPSSFSSTRARAPSRGSTSSTTTTSTTTTTTSTPPTRRSFQSSSNRVRPRPSFNSNRGRSGSRTSASGENTSSSESPTTQSSTTTTTAKARFTSSPRRFQSSRSRSTAGSTSTTRPPSSTPSSRSRPTSRRPNLISRSRPGRPGFPRSRPGSEIETTETTTPELEETSPSLSNENASPDASIENVSEIEETSDEPTTTEASRFSALFRPRNRNALGNRPRPVVGNRPSRP